MKNLFLCPLILLTFGFIQNASAETLPTKVKDYLKKNYPDWVLAKGCFSDPEIRSKSFVSGDFNGDGKLDYAVMIAKGGRGYTLALITTAKSFKAYNLKGEDYGDSTPLANLGVEKKGGKLAGQTFRIKTDAVIVAECDANMNVFYWQNGKFSKISVE